MKYLVTGAAGFIGFHTAKALMENGHEVIGLDNLNEYYDPKLKLARLDELRPFADQFRFNKLDIADGDVLAEYFKREQPQRVINLAAQPGVRYSITHPEVYIQSNLVGFANVLECCRHNKVEHLVYASSSSVYGANKVSPFSIHHNVDHPVSLYAATKKANELMAHTYSHLYDLPTTGLRFFTVYGPWGRPDMAAHKFIKAISEGKPIDVYNNGKMKRDFTYIDDIVEGILRVCDHVPVRNPNWDAVIADPGTSSAPYRVYNIGNNKPVELMEFIRVIEGCVGKKAIMNMLPMQPGDVLETCADVDDLMRDVGYRPGTDIKVGIQRTVEWEGLNSF